MRPQRQGGGTSICPIARRAPGETDLDIKATSDNTTLLGSGSLNAPAAATVKCQTSYDGVQVTDVTVIATRVGALH